VLDRLWNSVLQYRFRHVDSDHMVERIVDGRLGKFDCQADGNGNGFVLALLLRH
jgi:hypothetical protein